MKDYSKPAADEIDEIVRLSMLYDFYGPLLTDRNRQIFEDYIVNDMSLSEIADDIGITRQGVRDSIKRSEKALSHYEDKLQLVARFADSIDKKN
ncbi:MAG TPA: DNA-binding protein [Lachnospiraceae bacterium]|nr:DNA-binding protein [Lachnospiraceae bacterium]